MANSMARLFYGWLLLLRYTEVFSAPATVNIMEVMRKDLDGCKILSYLEGTDISTQCSTEEYPSNDLKLEYDNMNAFLCMGVYDASYKLCHRDSQWLNSLNGTVFNAYVEQRYEAEKLETERTKFCESIKNVTPVLEKESPLIVQLVDNLNRFCQVLCVDTAKTKFKPSCALIALANNIDKIAKTATTSKGNGNQPPVAKTTSDEPTRAEQIEDAAKSAQTVPEEEQPEAESNKKPVVESEEKADKQETVVINNEAKNPAKEKSTNVAQPKDTVNSKTAEGKAKPITNENAEEKTESKKTQKESKEQTQKESPKDLTLQSAVEKNQKHANIPASDPANETPRVEETGRENKETQNKDNLPESPENDAIAKSKTDIKPVNEDTKTDTRVDDSQDPEMTPDRQDYSRMEGIEESYTNDYTDAVADQPDANEQNQNMAEPSEQREPIPRFHSVRPIEESHFFTYFMVISLVCIAGYIGYHNKQKVLAIVLEGRRSRNNRGRRRPSTASYRKLDCTLEEAVTSQCNANVTHVIY